ncbi:MAG TPA: OsmC family protein [Gaiellaceae bacterium]|nr:OsmC family protein [Gaiellaceae bacterium]
MTGTFGGALEARRINASDGRLIGEATGEIEAEDGVLVIKRIHVRYLLRVDADAEREKIERAFEHHMPHCPVYRSIGAAIECTTELELLDT